MDTLSTLSAAAIAGCVLALLAGSLVKGVTGLGLPMVAMPILAAFVPVPQAMGLLSMPSLATSLWLMVSGGHFTRMLRRTWGLHAGIVLGVAATSHMLLTIDRHALYLILGVFVALFAVVMQVRVVFPVRPGAEWWGGPLAGFVSGAIGGVSMLFGPIYTMYLSGLGLTKDEFVAAVSIANLASTGAVAVSLVGYQLFGAADFALSLAATVLVFAGLAIGQRLRSHINETSFRRVLSLTLFAIGVSLVWKALA